MKYVLVAPKGHYFVNPSFFGWSFTKNIEEATKFDTSEQAEYAKDAVERGIASCSWAYDDELPFPTIREVGE